MWEKGVCSLFVENSPQFCVMFKLQVTVGVTSKRGFLANGATDRGAPGHLFFVLFFFSNSPFLPKVLGNKSLYYKNIQTRLGLIEVSPDSLFPERPARKVGRWPPASLHRLGIQ